MAEYTETFKRKEVKYRLSAAQVAKMKRSLEAHMAPDDYGQTAITSVYYDTAHRDMISRSLEKPLYKEKLRLRTYGERDANAPVFVELKKKHKGIVYKRRIAVSEGAAQMMMAGVLYEKAIALRPMIDAQLEAASHAAHNFQIAAEIAACVRRNGPLYPSMAISVERVAWAALPDARGAEAQGVRITFDERIRYRDLFQAQGERRSVALLGAGEAIMEVKVPGAYPLWLVDALNACGALPTSFSKYGEAYMACEGVKAPAAYREQAALDARLVSGEFELGSDDANDMEVVRGAHARRNVDLPKIAAGA